MIGYYIPADETRSKLRTRLCKNPLRVHTQSSKTHWNGRNPIASGRIGAIAATAPAAGSSHRRSGVGRRAVSSGGLLVNQERVRKHSRRWSAPRRRRRGPLIRRQLSGFLRLQVEMSFLLKNFLFNSQEKVLIA